MSSFLLSVVRRDLLLVEIRFVYFDCLNFAIFILFIKELLRHDGIASNLFSLDFFSHFYVFSFILQQFSWKDRLSNNLLLSNWALSLEMDNIIMLGCCNNSCFKDLLILWLISPGMRVDIMRFHVLTVDSTSDSWVCVAVTVGMEGRFPKVGSDCRIWQPSAGMFHLMNFLFNIFKLLGGLRSLLL